MLTPPRSRRAAASLPAADLKRRRFLLSLGASGASVAAVAATALPGVAAAQPAATAAPEHDAGYRETPHVRAYYRSAKL